MRGRAIFRYLPVCKLTFSEEQWRWKNLVKNSKSPWIKEQAQLSKDEVMQTICQYALLYAEEQNYHKKQAWHILLKKLKARKFDCYIFPLKQTEKRTCIYRF